MPLPASQLAAQQFSALEPHYRVVLIHPRYSEQHLLFSQFPSDCHYVRLYGDGLTLDKLRQQVNNLKRGELLVLDEADRAERGALLLFVHECLAAGVQRIIIVARELAGDLLSDSVLREITCVVPTLDQMMLWDYCRPMHSQMLLEVRAFGAGQVHFNGRPVNTWDGVLPRALFFYLVDRGMATRNEIFDTFWPTLSRKEATNVFHVTKRKISEVLGQDLTHYSSGYYHISGQIQLQYDVRMFAEVMQNGADETDEQDADAIRQAVALYRGSYLNSLTMPWVAARAHDLSQAYCDALLNLARMSEQAGALEQALGYTIRALAESPLREDIAHQVMRLYLALDRKTDALRVYDRLHKTLDRALHIAPSDPLRELAAAAGMNA